MPERWLITIPPRLIRLDIAASLPCRGSTHIETINHPVSRGILERFVKSTGRKLFCARTPRSLATAFAKPVVPRKSISAVSDAPGIARAGGLIWLFDEGNGIHLASNSRSSAGAGHKVGSRPLIRAIAMGTHRDQE